MDKKITTAYFPTYNYTNQYTQDVQKIIKSAGINIVPLKKYIFPLKDFFACKIFNFNWIEDCLDINTENKLKLKLKYLRMCLLFDIMKSLNKKIVWTMHNKRPHDDGKCGYKMKLMKKLVKCSSAIVVHCEDSIPALKTIDKNVNLNKVYVINHPNYISDYLDEKFFDLKQEFNIQDDECIFMFIGQVRKYKNIEILINAFRDLSLPKAKLIIAGKCDETYKKGLEAIIGDDKRIILNGEFIPDEKIASYYRTADIVVLPYNQKSSLNSGSAYMSFSLKTTVICPEIGTINHLKDKSFVYSYSYSNDDEHCEKLKETINAAYSDYENNNEIFKEKGERAYKYMLQEHSDDSIKAEYKKLYYKLLGYDEQ